MAMPQNDADKATGWQMNVGKKNALDSRMHQPATLATLTSLSFGFVWLNIHNVGRLLDILLDGHVCDHQNKSPKASDRP